jgi:hypothetical protein
MLNSRRFVGLGVLVAALAAVGVGVAAGDDGTMSPRSAAHQRVSGLVPSHAGRAASGVSGAGQLRYHGGPVEHTNTVRAIYWVPAGYSVSSTYEPLINRFFTDVAADSGKTSNVYYSDTQYYDGSGHSSYSSSVAAPYVDTNPYPASGCNDNVSQTTVCLTDAQLQAEITSLVNANAWPRGGSTEYFLFTPQNVGSCTDGGGRECAFSYYCAYHSWIGSGSNEILYANMPYTDTVPAACDGAPHPNGSDADPTISVVSHEHNETITDPNGNAWYDAAGYENGDKCAWNFGKSIGLTGSGAYNQLINGNTYEIQQEYSNATRRCVLTGT